jgi:RNA polymerase sigma-70 factor (ECF subfamily)
MQRDNPLPVSSDEPFVEIWTANHARLVARATRMLADQAAAEDIVQEAFRRLHEVPLDEIEDVGGWLAVVVRRLCLNRFRAAYVRHEAIGTEAPAVADVDPVDRVTLDDEVQAALSILLETLTPAERTAFVLHDVFGFPFDAVAVIVGRTPAAVRQLASRARRSIQRDAGPDVAVAASTPEHDIVVERFIAACEGGDIGELVAVLDPDIDGHAELIGFGTLADATGRPFVAQRLAGIFGPGSDTVMIPVSLEGETAIVAYSRGRLVGLVKVEHDDTVIRHVRAWVLRPQARPYR